MKTSISASLQMRKAFCFLLALSLAPASGFAAPDKRNELTAQTGTRVLIVGGEGLFPPSTDEGWTKIMLDVSGKFANALKENLASRGAPADVYVNVKKDRNIRSFLPKLLAHKLHHALIQVGIVSDGKGDLYIKPVYNPLEFRSDNTGMETYTALPGIDERYQILSAANPRAAMPGFSSLATQFADRLRQKGYIGK